MSMIWAITSHFPIKVIYKNGLCKPHSKVAIFQIVMKMVYLLTEVEYSQDYLCNISLLEEIDLSWWGNCWPFSQVVKNFLPDDTGSAVRSDILIARLDYFLPLYDVWE